MKKNVLYFKNLNLKTTPSQLLELFSIFGNVKQLRIIRDPVLLRSLGKGNIKMKNFHDAANCIEKLNGAFFMGKTISVTWAKRVALTV